MSQNGLWIVSGIVGGLGLGILLFLFPPVQLLVKLPGAIYLSELSWQTHRKQIALTLDDGPDPATTPLILEILKRHQAPATFFLIGERAQQHPQLVQQIWAAGHGVGNHVYTEEFSAASGGFAEKLTRTDQVLSQILGPNFTGTRWVRPGGGVYTPGMVNTIDTHPEYQAIVLGSVFPLDTHVPSVDFATWHILNRSHSGAIVVLHDAGTRGTRAAQTLDRIIPLLNHQGFQLVTLDQLLSEEAGSGPRP